jgi:hypothetical protein
MPSSPEYLERYQAGEHERVWAELQALGARVREGPLRADAFAVAHETMRRVRRDVETLLPRLEALGYRFYAHPTAYREHVPRWGGPPRWVDPPRLAVPDEETRAQLDELEREFGPLPLSLCAFYEVVGAVNFVGEPPAEEGWRGGTLEGTMYESMEGRMDGRMLGTLLDPLFIYGLRTNYAEWRGVREDEAPRAAYRPLLFPDFLVKYDFGGVGDVELEAPSAAMDAPLRLEGGELHWRDDEVCLFVPYLRFALLGRGGFPGMGMSPLWAAPMSETLRLRLVEGLVPF